MGRSASDFETVNAAIGKEVTKLTEKTFRVSAGIRSWLSWVGVDGTEKAGHDEFNELLVSNSAGKDVPTFAKNLLNSFFNPKLCKAPAKRTLSEVLRIAVDMGVTLSSTARPAGIAALALLV